VHKNVQERHLPRYCRIAERGIFLEHRKKYISKELAEYSRKTYPRNQNIREILEEQHQNSEKDISRKTQQLRKQITEWRTRP
jgi:hypothetical protein